jgi:hypothetical protein
LKVRPRRSTQIDADICRNCRRRSLAIPRRQS